MRSADAGRSAAPRLALSTMYRQRWSEAEGLAPFLLAARRLGVAAIELSHILPVEMLEGLLSADIQVTTLHHPCPRPPGWRDTDMLTAADPAARERAAAALSDTIATAQRLGAGTVVMHLGQLEDDDAETSRHLRFELEARQRAGLRHSKAYDTALARFHSWRDAREPAALERAWQGLQPLLAQAREGSIRLGLETGYHPHELPSPAGMAWLLGHAAAEGWAGTVGAWLDTGHVGAQDALGTARWAEWWAAVDGRWVGTHLHDHVGLRDHLLPGLGVLDFADLRPRLPQDAAVTLEVDWYFGEDEVAASLARLAAWGWPLVGWPRTVAHGP